MELQAADGRELLSVLAQPRRLALLAYLAAAAPRGFHRRDTLLALFWPEFDEERARNALRQAVHYLRRSLGEDVLLSRGAEELGLDRERFWCDAVGFEDALRSGDHAAALELYRGELLSGFFVKDAPDFERWLERERARLRERACDGAAALSTVAESAGALSSAVHWARRAFELDPDDEGRLRRLMTLLDRAGDTASALRIYRDFARRLAADYEAAPAPETQTLVNALRLPRGPGAEPAHGAAAGVTEVPTPQAGAPATAAAPSHPVPAAPESARFTSGPRPAPAGAPGATAGLQPPNPQLRGFEPSGPEALSPEAASPFSRVPPSKARPWTPRRSPLRARTLAVAAATLAFGLAVAVASRELRQRQRARLGTPSPESVVVLPFSVSGAETYAYLADGMVDLLSRHVDGVTRLRSVDPRIALSAAARLGAGPVNPARAREVAAQVNAGLYVLGSVVEAGGRLQLSATLYRQADGTAVATATTTGEAADVFRSAEELATRLLASYAGTTGTRLNRVAAQTTDSAAALKLYLLGESALRDGRYRDALDAFRRAIAVDSAFALAHYRLSVAADWLNENELARDAAARAARHSQRLAERDRLLLQAWHALLRGVGGEAQELYRAAIVAHPDDVEAWYRLAETLFHLGPRDGHSLADAQQAFHRVLELEPDHTDALVHLARIAALESDHAAVATLVARIFELQPHTNRALEMRALRAYALDDVTAQQHLAVEFRYAGDTILDLVTRAVAVYTDQLHGARELATLRTAPDRTPDSRARGYMYLAAIEAAAGRWHAAQNALTAARLPAAARFPAAAAHILAVAPFLGLPAPELRPLRDSIAAWDRALDRARGASPASRLTLYQAAAAHALAWTSAATGDADAARRYRARIATTRADERNAPFLARLARSAAAYQAFAAQDFATALERLGEPATHAPAGTDDLEVYLSAFDRYLYAELLRHAGRPADALRWYASFPDPSGYDVAFRAPASLRRAELYEALGDTKLAATYYARFLALWRDADPALQPVVTEAQRRLQRLEPPPTAR